MTTNIEKKENYDHVIGPRPVHVHTAPSDGLRWSCNSPYCNYLDTEPPERGGLPIVHEGMEPWRGR